MKMKIRNEFVNVVAGMSNEELGKVVKEYILEADVNVMEYWWGDRKIIRVLVEVMRDFNLSVAKYKKEGSM